MKTNKAYLIGIKGVGMAALAIYLKESGWEVTGSDCGESFVTEKKLKEAGISYFESFDIKNIRGCKPDMVVVSAAYGKENPEVKEFKKRKIDVQYYSETLGKITSSKKLIAVAGVHGKTTTTAMISYLLKKAKLDPSFIVGAGDIRDLGNNAHCGNGDYFVLEADEYRKSPLELKPKFLDLSPEIAIITSIELDHPDVFSGIEEIYNAFYLFSCRVSRKGFIVLCVDYQKAKKLHQSIADRNFETYGFDDGAKWQIVKYKENSEETTFMIKNGLNIHGPFSLSVPGKHNVLNATAAIIVAIKIGVDENVIKKTMEGFSGVQRRFELVGKSGGTTVIDDYAHHPTAIEKTLAAVKDKYPNNSIWCIFQPHTFSRTKALLKEFGSAFRDADSVIITDIYSSAREKDRTVSEAELINEIRKYQSNVKHINDWSRIKTNILTSLKEPSVVITIGAGDIYKLGREILKTLKNKTVNE